MLDHVPHALEVGSEFNLRSTWEVEDHKTKVGVINTQSMDNNLIAAVYAFERPQKRNASYADEFWILSPLEPQIPPNLWSKSRQFIRHALYVFVT